MPGKGPPSTSTFETLPSGSNANGLLACTACSDDGSNGQPNDGDADTGVESEDVVVRFVNRWGHSDNAPVERPNRYGTNTPIIVATVDGQAPRPPAREQENDAESAIDYLG